MSHITYEQRYTIEVMLSQGQKQSMIAAAIGKDKSVISREIKRNKDGRSGKYTADLAHRKSERRHQDKPKSIRFTATIQAQVEGLLYQQYSPEQIVGRLGKEGKECVSHERIYQHIWKDKKGGGDLHTHLRSRGRRYKKRGATKASRGLIPNRIGIEKRPDIVDRKSRFGDLEMDTIIGKNHQTAIVTINDRASGMLKMKKVNNKTAAAVRKASIEILQEWKPYIHTATADNGLEFAQHDLISQNIGINIYFARPYHSWERGANENLNGLVRQYFPKKTDFTTITDQQIIEVENILNNRPRKRLNFETPIERMEKLLFHNQVAFVT